MPNKESLEQQNLQFYTFADGIFSFWEAKINDKQSIIFRVRNDSTPAKRALEKGISNGISLYPAKKEPVQKWLNSHPDYPIIE
ncbi:MAG: hypothetical protein WC460_02180 [Patescibacteria group bacterium]